MSFNIQIGLFVSDPLLIIMLTISLNFTINASLVVLPCIASRVVVNLAVVTRK